MSARVALREYYIRNNDLTIMLAKCHEILSAPQYTDRERCYLYLFCVNSAKYHLSAAPFLSMRGDLLGDSVESAKKIIELVDKCAEELYTKASAEYKSIVQNPAYSDHCARAAALAACIKSVASTVLAAVLAGMLTSER